MEGETLDFFYFLEEVDGDLECCCFLGETEDLNFDGDFVLLEGEASFSSGDFSASIGDLVSTAGYLSSEL